jgi:hypothetical protein
MAKKMKLYEVCGQYNIIVNSDRTIPQSVTKFYWAKSEDDALDMFRNYFNTVEYEIGYTDLVEFVFDYSEIVGCYA